MAGLLGMDNSRMQRKKPHMDGGGASDSAAPPLKKQRRVGGAGRPARAVQFISLIGDKYVVQPEAVEFLKELEGPLAVIAVAGKYRTGKSFLLNNVLLELPAVGGGGGGGFGVGPSIQPCTKGLWLYTQAIPCASAGEPPLQALIIDTEGIGATQNTDDTHDTRIFSLAMLLSSYFIYNSRGCIDEDALASMSLVVNISKSVTVSASKRKEDIAPYMPLFMWVVRDFALQLLDENAQPLSEGAYLESALREAGEPAQPKNAVRRTIKQYFPRRDCVTLVRPTEDEAALQDLTDAVLRPKFKEQAAGLRKRVFASLTAKTACGRAVTGAMLAELACAYADAINRGAAPAIKDTWTLVSENHCRASLDTAVEGFARSTAALDLCCSTEMLLTALDDSRSAALEGFGLTAFGDRVPTVRAALDVALASHRDGVLKAHAARIHAHADRAALDVAGLDMVTCSFQDIHRACDTQRAAFSASVSGSPEALKTWDAYVLKSVWGWVSSFYGSTETRLATLRAEAAEHAMAQAAQRTAYEADLAAHARAAASAGAAADAARLTASERASEKVQLEVAVAAGDARCMRLQARVKQLEADLEDKMASGDREAATALSADAERLVLQLKEAEETAHKAREAARRTREECADLEGQYQRDAADVRADALRTVDELRQARDADARAAEEREAELLEEAAEAARVAVEKLAHADKKYEGAVERAAAVSSTLKEELEKVRAEARQTADAVRAQLKAQQAEVARVQDEWRKDVSAKHAAATEAAEAQAALRVAWSEKTAGYEARLRFAEEAATEAAAARGAAADAMQRVRTAEAEARAASNEGVRLLTETKHLRDVKASLDRQLDELRDQVIALERKCKDVERSRDVELTKLRMSYERQLSGSRGGT